MGCRREGWTDGGVRALAIILHRFTPVRDGWTCNEVWDLGVATCACLCLIAFWMYCGMMCRYCVCVSVCYMQILMTNQLWLNSKSGCLQDALLERAIELLHNLPSERFKYFYTLWVWNDVKMRELCIIVKLVIVRTLLSLIWMTHINKLKPKRPIYTQIENWASGCKKKIHPSGLTLKGIPEYVIVLCLLTTVLHQLLDIYSQWKSLISSCLIICITV